MENNKLTMNGETTILSMLLDEVNDILDQYVDDFSEDLSEFDMKIISDWRLYTTLTFNFTDDVPYRYRNVSYFSHRDIKEYGRLWLFRKLFENLRMLLVYDDYLKEWDVKNIQDVFRNSMFVNDGIDNRTYTKARDEDIVMYKMIH